MPKRRQLERDHSQFGEWDRNSGDFVLRIASVSRLLGLNYDTIICRHLGLNAKDAAAFVAAQRAAHLAGLGRAEIAATMQPTPVAANTEGRWKLARYSPWRASRFRVRLRHSVPPSA
jgi:hypothetical protein